ncbi:MAG: hypothetical protein P4L16_05145 [Chlamydiales bacterium]|nr:hypothetical protein [Chlamydiales bacterium]
MEQSKLIPILQTPPWKNNPNSIWIATNLKIYRNVNKYLFPGKLDRERQRQLSNILQSAVISLKALNNPSHIFAKELSAAEKHFLFEHFLGVESFHEAHGEEAFVIDNSGGFLALINVKDHLQLQVTDYKTEIENAWDFLVKIETEIGKSIDYSFSSRFGFLTSSPKHCGTAFIGTAYLHVPLLVHTNHLSTFLENELNEMIEAASLQGDLTELIGDLLTLHNKVTIGISEEEIVKMLRITATKLMMAEKSARTTLKGHEESLIKNKVSRAYGLLVHSYQIETVEALNALSLCKLAVDLQWLKGIDHTLLNELFFSCRMGHLMSIYPDVLDPEDFSKKRAEIIHKAFKDTNLLV